MRLIRCWLWYAATVSSTVSRIDRPRGDAMDAAIAGQERGAGAASRPDSLAAWEEVGREGRRVGRRREKKKKGAFKIGDRRGRRCGK